MMHLNKTRCSYRGNGFVCVNGFDVEDDRLICPKCSGTGYIANSNNKGD